MFKIKCFFISELSHFKLQTELKEACEIHSKDHLAIHITHELSYHLPPEIVTVVEIEDC
jgi:hypothetical protein